jgi:hypothetical protein
MVRNEDGTESPAMIVEYSDYLLDRLLRARRPSKFRDNYTPDVSDIRTYKVVLRDRRVVEGVGAMVRLLTAPLTFRGIAC